MVRKSRRLSPSWASPIHRTVFASGFSTKSVYQSLTAAVPSAFPAYYTCLDFSIIIMFDEKIKWSRRSDLIRYNNCLALCCNISERGGPQPPVASCGWQYGVRWYTSLSDLAGRQFAAHANGKLAVTCCLHTFHALIFFFCARVGTSVPPWDRFNVSGDYVEVWCVPSATSRRENNILDIIFETSSTFCGQNTYFFNL